MNRIRTVEGVSAFRQRRDNHAHIENGSGHFQPPAQAFRSLRYARLGLNTIKLIFVLLAVAVPLHFAYHFAQEKAALQQAAYQRVRSLHPLDYEGEPMAREWARKVLKDIAYTKRWYECIGEGEARVFLWTLTFLA